MFISCSKINLKETNRDECSAQSLRPAGIVSGSTDCADYILIIMRSIIDDFPSQHSKGLMNDFK